MFNWFDVDVFQNLILKSDTELQSCFLLLQGVKRMFSFHKNVHVTFLDSELQKNQLLDRFTDREKVLT